MPDSPTHPDDEELQNEDQEQERGIGDDEEQFEDTEDLDEEEDEDEEEENLDSRGMSEDRRFTSEIGSEGGSQGDLEVDRRRPRVMRGSEASTTARTDQQRGFDDRREGGGLARPRR